MLKKMFAGLTIAALALGVTACSGGEEKKDDAAKSSEKTDGGDATKDGGN